MSKIINIQGLAQYMNMAAVRPNQLGTYDCVVFVTDMLRIGWNRDYRSLLGYHDRRSAIARLRASGGLRRAFSEAIGPEMPATSLDPGDVVYFEDPATVGVLLPDYCAVKWGRTIHRVPLPECKTGWRSY